MNGAYFMANDEVYPLVIAFLESFRASNPAISLTCIPFDSRIKRIVSVAEIFGFTMFDNPVVLAQCDGIGNHFLPGRSAAFRKLAAWNGPYDHFIYIDVDTVVLRNVEFAFKLLHGFDFVASQSNMPSTRQWVWRETITEADGLSEDQVAFSASTGFFASSKSDWFRAFISGEMLSGALTLKPHMQLHCMEQPYLNYCIVSSGMHYTSLSCLKQSTGDSSISLEQWAGSPGAKVHDLSISFPGKPPVLLLHWAGLWRPRRHERIVNTCLERAGISRDLSPVSWHMPYAGLWKRHYHRARMRVTAGSL